MSNVKNEIRNLIEYLNQRTKEYDEGHPTITDTEWDEKYFKLKDLENKFRIIYNDSPTQSISYEVINSLKKSEHNHSMLSLDKTKSIEEVASFIGKKESIAMLKMDGLTCSLKYSKGQLVSAETRGNGLIGEDILHNAKVINSIPKYINYADDLIIDGEVVCLIDDFEEFKEEYKNPRNFASGSIRLLDSKECAKRKLTFIAWDVIEGFDFIKTVSGKLKSIEKLGFSIVPFCSYQTESADNSQIELMTIIEQLKETANQIYYPIDGIVFKFDNIEYGKSLGFTAHHFKNAIAFKFADEVVKSKLVNIDWTIGRTGVLTPVAVFEDVELEGSIVSRASLHNISIMEEVLGKPYYGQEVEIFKANMIIPQIKSAVKKSDCEAEYFEIPKVCPICGQPTTIHKENLSAILMCDNKDCSGKLINHLDHYCGKKGMDIKGLSKATLEKLINWGWVDKVSDIYELSNFYTYWMEKPGFGAKSVSNILAAIQNSRKCTLDKFIAALGIDLIGSTASKDLANYFKTWDNFIEAVKSGFHFYDLPNFGYETHQAIINFNYDEANEIYNNYLTIDPIVVEDNSKNDLNGITVVITGKLNHFKNRDEMKSAIEARGGKVVGSISSKTTCLINNDINSTSSKNVSAKKLNIPILSEDAFIETYGF